jgi:3-hydroxyisobutyrate dehydrogenase-like beta-hydroxyacid dehydrogenase
MTTSPALGWLGTGRMGSAMARRLIDAGHHTTVWNRTRSKTDALARAGAHVVDEMTDLARADIVFIMVSTPKDLDEVVNGPQGLLSADTPPRMIVDCSTVDTHASTRVREALDARGVKFLAAPISGNPHVVADGEAVLVASGPKETYDLAEPYLAAIGKSVVWVGEDERARLVKICHNLYLGLIAQSLSEVTTLAEKAGVPRGAFLAFLNDTVLGTDWVRKRTPDLLSLDWTPTFTTELLRKDFDLGLAAARQEEVTMPLSASVLQLIQAAIGRGYRDRDFLSLFEVQAMSSGMEVKPQ